MLQLLATSTVAGENNWVFEVEAMKGWVEGAEAPPLVSTSPSNVTRAEAGVLSSGDSSVLFGRGEIDASHRTGFRVEARSKALADEPGIFVSVLYLDAADDPESIFSSQDWPILARPYFNADTLTEDSQLVGFPDIVDGTVSIRTDSELVGADIAMSFLANEDTSLRKEIFGGYRFIGFEDSVSIAEDLVSIDTGGFIPLGTNFEVHDIFRAANRFHGGLLGLRLERDFKNWGFQTDGKLGIGSMRRVASNVGGTTVTVPGLTPDTYPGGLLSQPTNMGEVRSSSIVVIPEVRTVLRRRLTEHANLQFAYSFLLLPDIWRSAEAIDYQVNDTQIGGGTLIGAARPQQMLSSSDVWLQTISIGGSFTW